MKRLNTITIGIPAYNEEDNIAELISSLLNQNYGECRLTKIIVVSDASTDNTNMLVNKFKEKVELIINSKRQGNSYGQNLILKKTKTDYLVLINADVLPVNQNLIINLVRPLIINKQVALTSGDTLSLNPRTFFEKVIVSGRETRKNIYRSTNNSDNIYLCHGRIRALSKNFHQKINFINSLPEDAYSYLKCKDYGFEFTYVPEAKVTFRSPSNLSEHLKQSRRFQLGKKQLIKYFGKNRINNEYKLPLDKSLSKSIYAFVKHPFLTICYIAVLTYSRLFRGRDKNNHYFSLWEVSRTSKII